MIKVGLTGNIGSGKSTVSRIFETLGVPVFHADDEAKKFLSHPNVQPYLDKEYGNAVFIDGMVDRKALAEIVFNDKAALRKLNSIIHPLVRAAFFSWTDKYANRPYVIQEAAILFESDFYKFFDKIIMVSCDEKIAIRRVMIRDGVNETQVKKRLQNQMRQEDKISRSDFIISNNEDEMILPQVLKVHSQLNIS